MNDAAAVEVPLLPLKHQRTAAATHPPTPRRTLRSRAHAFLRKLCQQLDGEYNGPFRQTVSYWAAVCFIFGSIQLAFGSSAWFYDLDEIHEEALVTWPYRLGSGFFVTGLLIRWFGSDSKDLATKSFAAGSFVYNTKYITGFLGANETFIYVCGVIGGMFFTLGAIFEVKTNECWKWKPFKLTWWAAYADLIGGICFMVACIAKLVNDRFMVFVKGCYAVGSFTYFISGIISLIIWKLKLLCSNGYVSLATVPQIKEQYTMRMMHIPFIILYISGCCISIRGVVYSAYCHHSLFYTNIIAVVLNVSLLIVGSELHRVQKRKSLENLVWLLRISMIFYIFKLFSENRNIC